MEIKDIKFTFNNEVTFLGSQLLNYPDGLSSTDITYITESTNDGIGDIELGSELLPRQFRFEFEVPRISGDRYKRYFKRGVVYELKIDKRKCKCSLTYSNLSNSDGFYVDPILILEFRCSDPYFYDVDEFGKNIAGIHPTFKFPYTVTKEKPLVMGYYMFSDTTVFPNNGDVKVGLKVVLKAARGEASNITFKNLKTSKFISLPSLTLNKGESLIISTIRKEKTVYKLNEQGVPISIFDKIDPLSEFFYLDVGDNLLSYDAEIGKTNLDVNLYYAPVYLNGLDVV